MSQRWEETKRSAQSISNGIYKTLGDVFQSAYGNIGNSYQQVLITGHLYPSIGHDQLNHQIAEDAYNKPEPGVQGPEMDHDTAVREGIDYS